jgi:hypothetical protein
MSNSASKPVRGQFGTANVTMRGGTPMIVPGTFEPTDVNKLSLRERALLEVAAEQIERSLANGTQTFEVTR